MKQSTFAKRNEKRIKDSKGYTFLDKMSNRPNFDALHYTKAYFGIR